MAVENIIMNSDQVSKEEGGIVVEMELEEKIVVDEIHFLHTELTQDFTETQNDEADAFEIELEEDKEGNREENGNDDVDSKTLQKEANTFAAKKTVAQGMMDIALITANANQLRYIIEFSQKSSTYYLNLILISISLLLQIGVGVSLIFKGRMDLRGQSKHENAKRINNYVLVGVFLVTIINVFIASFTITGNNSS